MYRVQNQNLAKLIPDPRSIAHKGDLKTMDQGSVLVATAYTTRSCPEAVIIKAHTSGAYISYLMLDNRFVK